MTGAYERFEQRVPLHSTPVVLGFITFVFFIMAAIMAIFYGLTAQEVANTESTEVRYKKTFCDTGACLQAASFSKSLMNLNADPCEDFYEYACGNYKVMNPVHYFQRFRSVTNDMREDNLQRVISLLKEPKYDDNSYATKLKTIFTACLNTNRRERYKGKPFISSVLPVIGGWKAIGTWNESEWQWEDALMKLQSIGVTALYQTHLTYAPHRKLMIVLNPQFRDQLSYHGSNVSTSIKELASFLVRDAQGYKTIEQIPNNTLSVIEEFVSDVLAVGSKLEHNSERKREKLTLATLKTNSGIDWVSQLKYLYKVHDNSINSSTTVVSYIKQIGTTIKNLPETTRKRMLHNYFVWRALSFYLEDLSWEYYHSPLNEVYTNYYRGTERQCLWSMHWSMSMGMGAMFIDRYLQDLNKQEVKDITSNIRLALQQQLEKLPWMDDQTRQYAKKKLDVVRFKVAHPDWWEKNTNMDAVYATLSVSYNAHFNNTLSQYQFHRDFVAAEFMRDMEIPEDDYLYPAYAVAVHSFFGVNDLYVTSGNLMPPIYDKDQPHFITFGSLGSPIARSLYAFVDVLGNYFDINGTLQDKSWWSQETTDKFKKVGDCIHDLYKDVTETRLDEWGNAKNVPANIPANWALAYTYGLRLALTAYKDWMNTQPSGSSEKKLPGLELTNEQMVFLSSIQMSCHSVNYTTFERHPINRRLLSNMALGQLEEFSKVFNCKSNATMNHNKKCGIY